MVWQESNVRSIQTQTTFLRLQFSNPREMLSAGDRERLAGAWARLDEDRQSMAVCMLVRSHHSGEDSKSSCGLPISMYTI